ncbi:D-inositol-3-phosphate glycosyltransferase [Nakamurella panacisegetis]|uniref:D-inositol-3-phosphate glycosyltransferase n=1 Tax=Nakamurella panacisegetis TaxID=1090615 RepID=A0A1H0JGI4_9ACTN|nr:D-inositol-3-phosphate glycosyltransferase [Nakamurella panacisegetis]SDO42692.1 D-inositol-3-phosphate glycosyltransferase [Nakamurella panacisegetis]
MTTRSSRPALRRLAAISLHTSPLAQPGTGDAGGMNVYVAQTAVTLAARGVEVEIFTRATSSDCPPTQEMVPGVLVRHIAAGPFEGLDKDELPGQLCSFAAGVMRAEARQEPGYYDLLHSHYWLSGQVGYLAKDRWGVPLVHSAHTLAKVKNAAMAESDQPEPRGRLIGEEQVVAEADRLIANTDTEARELVELYGAAPDRIDVVPPGVDTELFRPGSKAEARAALGLADDEVVLTFAGRIQPLKAPDVLLRAVAVLRDRYPGRRFRAVVVGGASGTGRIAPHRLSELTAELGISGLVDFLPPMPPARLCQVFQASDAVAVPSYNESFGLVALEAQAAGTPVVAAAVGGLRVAVDDGVSGLLVAGHQPQHWADRLAEAVLDPRRQARLAANAPAQAAKFSWDRTVDGLLESYDRALFAAAPVHV